MTDRILDQTEVNPGELGFRDKPMSYYSLTLSEEIGKDARRKLVALCLRGYQKELRDKPPSRYSRGRPKSAVALLAEAVGISRRTVQRWLYGEGSRACDVNAGRLAEIACSFYPEETGRILIDDVEGYSTRLNGWLNHMGVGISATSPCRIIHASPEEKPE